jgi:hypothetical protein
MGFLHANRANVLERTAHVRRIRACRGGIRPDGVELLRESGLFSMKVAGLENSRKQPLDFQNDSILPLDRIGEIIRRILREELWCRLESSEGFIHFSWDYYMYVGVPHPCPTAEARAAELGLYVEEFASPIRESVREAEAESW